MLVFFRKKRFTPGFTFIEVILAMVVFAVGLTTLYNIFYEVLRTNQSSNKTIQARQLAREGIDKVLYDKVRYGWDNVTTANFPEESIQGYVRSYTINEVSENDFSVLQNGTGFKSITVSVSGQGQTVSLVTILSDWVAP